MVLGGWWQAGLCLGPDVLTPFAPVSTCVYQVKGLGTVCIGLGTVCIR